MNKKQFITLVCGVVAGLLFSVGLCMCLLPEWNAFTAGVVLTALGGVALIALGIRAWLKGRKNAKKVKKSLENLLIQN